MAQTFCEKIALNCQLADLLIKRSQLGLIRRRAVLPIAIASRKQRRRSIQQRLLPGMDLAGMHAEPARKLSYRAVLPHRRQRNLCLELSAVLLPSVGHVSPSANRRLQGQTLS
jgi:hypothetical protein